MSLKRKMERNVLRKHVGNKNLKDAFHDFKQKQAQAEKKNKNK